jgi:hypothetical protein
VGTDEVRAIWISLERETVPGVPHPVSELHANTLQGHRELFCDALGQLRKGQLSGSAL